MPQRLLSWRALGKLQQPVKARSIRVINITVKHFTQLLVQTDTAPAVNQVEVHPYLYPRELLEF
ncbi:MAG TPA: aldo/keto reductase, partial [Acidobacteriota bacterium]|nr:aldo/keto reductase [Acidobacteriota bacterium]